MVLKYRWAQGPDGALFREPRAINAAQFIMYAVAAVSGGLAVMGGLPTIITGQIGPLLAASVGTVLLIGGLLGALSVLYGNWWLERVALLIVGVGWLMMMPATFSYAVSGRGSSYQVWLIIALLFAALGDCFKRYLRIQWAYLDPQR